MIFRLFVSTVEQAPQSISEFEKLRERFISSDYVLKVIVAQQQPDLLRKYRVHAMPTLTLTDDRGECRVVGRLSETTAVARGLKLLQPEARSSHHSNVSAKAIGESP